jgi:hypothetical protein
MSVELLLYFEFLRDRENNRYKEIFSNENSKLLRMPLRLEEFSLAACAAGT